MNWFGGGWLMMSFWLMLIAGVIFLIIKSITGQQTTNIHEDSAREILDKRYAREEISKPEYQETLTELLTSTQENKS